MLKKWSVCHFYLSFSQLALVSGIMLSTLCHGQSSPAASALNRMPASYIPDDDVIVAPIENELSFYQRYVASDKSNDVIQSRNQMKIWNDNQAFAEQYGLDSSLAGSAFFVPTSEEKFEYFKSKYMRYLKNQSERPVKDAPKTWYQEYRASNEVDTIDEMEGRFKSTQGKSSQVSTLPKSLQPKSVNIWKKTQFIFQPRVDQGLVVVGIKNALVYARAWVGVNGQAEFNVQHKVDSVGFRAMFNYYAHTGKYFSSFDQALGNNLYARLTLTKDPTTEINDNTAMLLYAKQF